MTNIKNSLKASYRSIVLAGFAAAALAVVAIPAMTQAATLNRSLSVGMSGSDVSALQTFLSQSNAIYPQGLVTGYYGFLTQAAVSNFQARNEINPLGMVGPITLPILNLQIQTGMANAEGARVTSLTTDADTAGRAIVYSTNTNTNSTYTGTVAPVITGININTARNSATVSWNTDQAATGVVFYNTSPLNLSSSLTSVSVTGGYSAMTDTTFRTYQSVMLPNLAANTVYYYMIYTTDQAGNVSVSWPTTLVTAN